MPTPIISGPRSPSPSRPVTGRHSASPGVTRSHLASLHVSTLLHTTPLGGRHCTDAASSRHRRRRRRRRPLRPGWQHPSALTSPPHCSHLSSPPGLLRQTPRYAAAAGRSPGQYRKVKGVGTECPYPRQTRQVRSHGKGDYCGIAQSCDSTKRTAFK